jgi:hypothetical protein
VHTLTSAHQCIHPDNCTVVHTLTSAHQCTHPTIGTVVHTLTLAHQCTHPTIGTVVHTLTSAHQCIHPDNCTVVHTLTSAHQCTHPTTGTVVHTLTLAHQCTHPNIGVSNVSDSLFCVPKLLKSQLRIIRLIKGDTLFSRQTVYIINRLFSALFTYFVSMYACFTPTQRKQIPSSASQFRIVTTYRESWSVLKQIHLNNVTFAV